MAPSRANDSLAGHDVVPSIATHPTSGSGSRNLVADVGFALARAALAQRRLHHMGLRGCCGRLFSAKRLLIVPPTGHRIARRQAVDVSPLRRVNQAIYLICTGARTPCASPKCGAEYSFSSVVVYRPGSSRASSRNGFATAGAPLPTDFCVCPQASAQLFPFFSRLWSNLSKPGSKCRRSP